MIFKNILFVDIETVGQYQNFNQLSSEWKELWKHQVQGFLKQNETETLEGSYTRAGLYAEFGKIVCISCGYLHENAEGKLEWRYKSFYGPDEKSLLLKFADMLNDWKNEQPTLCAHNGKNFDFPFICRRMVINGIKIPAILNIVGKKPWEIRHLDTLEMWKFGDFKHYTSLNLLAQILGIPSPKDDIDGSQVHEVYWKEKDLERIKTYCEKDIRTLAKVYSKLAKCLTD